MKQDMACEKVVNRLLPVCCSDPYSFFFKVIQFKKKKKKKDLTFSAMTNHHYIKNKAKKNCHMLLSISKYAVLVITLKEHKRVLWDKEST